VLSLLSRRLSSLLFTVPAVAMGVLLWSGGGDADIGSSLHRVLPLVLLFLGGGLCLLYTRIRTLFLLLALYLAMVVLQVEVVQFQRAGILAADTPLVFHSVSLWLPLVFALIGLWPERGSPRRDISVRLTVLATVLGPFCLLAGQDPEGMQRLISDTHWPAISTGFSALAQLPGWAFLLALLGLGLHAHRNRRPSNLASVLALGCMYLMLPRIFHTPLLLATVPVVAMVLLISAVVQEAFDLAFRDDLTGLPGRRALNEALKRLGGQYTIAMVDVDHFKKFNDTHGHDAGDEVLKLVARRLGQVGGGGRAFRYGGEEFSLVFAGCDARSAREAIEDVRVAVEKSRMQLRNRGDRDRDDSRGQQRRGQGGSGATVNVTVSIGVADHRAGSTPQAVIKAADKALYAAKDGGRNCVRVHGLRSVSDIVAGKPAASTH
jgi:diguanylate cyclase (GGDEF)-like protein